jgi:hypothetical protein
MPARAGVAGVSRDAIVRASTDAARTTGLWAAGHRGGRHCWDDGSALRLSAMYTDWTAVILLLLTAAPLAVVVATAAFFILRQKKTQRL